MKQSNAQQRPLVNKRRNVRFRVSGQSNGKLPPEDRELLPILKVSTPNIIAEINQ